MSGGTSGSNDTHPQEIDRRWFEEALRSQGFVVEPPDEGGPVAPEDEVAVSQALHEPGVTPLAEAPSADAVPGVPTSTSDAAPPERPPVPSALLARIAARGQGPTPVEAATDPAPSEVPVPGELGLAVSTGTAPWEVAVATSVAPWTSVPVAEPEPQPQPETVTAAEPEPQPQPETVPVAEPEPQPEPETVTAAEPVTPNVPGPSAQVDASVQASSAARAPSPSASAESSEGELWALVGATGPADGSAPRSSVMRVALTVLMALVILVIVVASLVLASQVA